MYSYSPIQKIIIASTIIYIFFINTRSVASPASVVPLPKNQGYLHITYTADIYKHEVPREFLNLFIEAQNRKINDAKKGEGTNARRQSETMKQAILESGKPYTASVRSEYWENDGTMTWIIENPSIKAVQLYSYDGKLIANGVANAIPELVSDPNAKAPDGTTLKIGRKDKDFLEKSIPYLGFNQPGMSLFLRPMNVQEQASPDGGKVIKYGASKNPSVEYCLFFDKNMHMARLEIRRGKYKKKGAIYTYREFKKLNNGFIYPNIITEQRFDYYKDGFGNRKTFISYSNTYRVCDISIMPFSANITRFQKLTAGTIVQDIRVDSGRYSDGIAYVYTGDKPSVFEASKSALLEKKQRNKDEEEVQDKSPRQVIITVRIISLILLLTLASYLIKRFKYFKR